MYFFTLSVVMVLFYLKPPSCCLVAGSPILKATGDAQSTEPLLTSSGIIARDEPPEDFGTEEVTVTIDGNTFSYTRHIGIKVEGGDGEDEVIHISSRLFKAISDVVEDVTICSSIFRPVDILTFNPSGLPGSEFSSSTATIDPTTLPDTAQLDEIIVGPCTLTRLDYILSHMNPSGPLMDLIPAADNADIVREFANPEVGRLYEATNAIGDLQAQMVPFTVRRRRTGTMALLDIINAFERQIYFRLALRILAQNLQTEPTTRDCGEDEDAPACPDPDCAGEKGKCTTKVNAGCTCYPLKIWPDSAITWDQSSFDEQQQIFHASNPSAPDNANLVCNGIGNIPAISNEAGEKAVKDFCGTTPISGSKDNQPPAKDFNQGTSDAVVLGIEFDQAFSISTDECNAFFNLVLTDCDGNNPVNPNNLKHGGKITHPKGATFFVSPSNAIDLRCNGYGSQKWVDRDLGHDKILQFCKETSLRGLWGDKSSTVYNQGKNTEVSLGAEWTKDAPMTFDECVETFGRVLDGCDGLDPINNPLNNKYGGTYTTDLGVVVVIAPSVIPPTFPPDAIDPSGTEIVPQCSGGYFTGEGDLERALADYCQDGHDLYKSSFCYKHGLGGCDGSITLTSSGVNDDETYKQGAPVCRGTTDWNRGKIRGQDCMDAMHAMRQKCDQSASFVYNCVKWEYHTSIWATDHQLSTASASQPNCGVYGYTAPLLDLNLIAVELEQRSDQRCCKQPTGGSENIAVGGKTGVNLWSESPVEICVPCSTLSSYVTNLSTICRQGDTFETALIGGTQDVVEAPGLRIEI